MTCEGEPSPKMFTFGLDLGDPNKPAFEQVELFKLLTNKPHPTIFTENDIESIETGKLNERVVKGYESGI